MSKALAIPDKILSVVRAVPTRHHNQRPLEAMRAAFVTGVSELPTEEEHAEYEGNVIHYPFTGAVNMRCSSCGDFGDLVRCQAPGCPIAICCDWINEAGIFHPGCLSRNEIQDAQRSIDWQFYCPSCSVRHRKLFKLSYNANQSHFLRSQVTAPLMWISVVWEGQPVHSLKAQLEGSLSSMYSQVSPDLLCKQNIVLGNIGPQKRFQSVPMHSDADILVTLETHSVIGTGEVVHGSTNTGMPRTSLLSVVLEKYLSKKVTNHIIRSKNSKKGMILLVCGPLLQVDTSRKDLEEVMHSLGLTYVIGFSSFTVNPLTVSDAVNSFCFSLHCRGQSVDEAFVETFGGQREMLSHCPLVLMTRDSESKKISSLMLCYGTVTHMPWGVPKPKCSACNTNMNVQARKKGENSVRWSCLCGLVGVGAMSKPDWAQEVDANWLRNIYLIPYPVPSLPPVQWRQK